MLPILILLAAAASQQGAQATARATARVVQGERIALAAATPQTDRQLTQRVRRLAPDAEPVRLRLVEFQ